MSANMVSLFDASLSDDELDERISARVDKVQGRVNRVTLSAVGTRRALSADVTPRVSRGRSDYVRAAGVK